MLRGCNILELGKYCFSAAYITRLLGGHDNDDDDDVPNADRTESAVAEVRMGDSDESLASIEIKQDVSGVGKSLSSHYFFCAHTLRV